MSTCADSTTLRAHLDHPDAALEAHLDGCDVCPGLLAAVAADMGTTRQALSLLDRDVPADVDVDGALTAVVSRAATAPAPAMAHPARGLIARSPVDRVLAAVGPQLAVAAAVALLALAVALTPAGRSAVAQALDSFRGQQLQVVSFDPSALQVDEADLQALSALGDVDLADLARPADVADMAAAEGVAGIAGPTLADPPDRLVAAAPGTVSLTLLARDGNGMPAQLDGAVLEVSLPGLIGAVYGNAEMPEMVIGRSGLLQIDAHGAPLAEVRAFLLSRPELPEDLRAQLAAIEDWRSTLPIPVPVDGPGWRDVTIGGRPGVAFGDSSGLGTLVLRQDTDGITAVGGSLAVEEALAIAAGA
ncbi:MAG TPA: hypothetical protein VMM13_01540 [Euzebya sp.]|nr:hypothetical protein [Euzebya sp.]